MHILIKYVNRISCHLHHDKSQWKHIKHIIKTVYDTLIIGAHHLPFSQVLRLSGNFWKPTMAICVKGRLYTTFTAKDNEEVQTGLQLKSRDKVFTVKLSFFLNKHTYTWAHTQIGASYKDSGEFLLLAKA